MSQKAQPKAQTFLSLIALLLCLNSCSEVGNNNATDILGDWLVVSGYEDEEEEEGLLECIWTFDEQILYTVSTYDNGDIDLDGPYAYDLEDDFLTIAAPFLTTSQILYLDDSEMTLLMNHAFGSVELGLEKQ